MKLKLTIVLCMLALVTMIGCSDDDNGVGHDAGLVGTWNLTGAKVDGQSIKHPSWSLTFIAGGTGSMTFEGNTESMKWSTSGNELTLSSPTNPADENLTGIYSLSGNTLTYTFSEEGSTFELTWTKQT